MILETREAICVIPDLNVAETNSFVYVCACMCVYVHVHMHTWPNSTVPWGPAWTIYFPFVSVVAITPSMVLGGLGN